MSFNLQSAFDDLFKPPSRLQNLVDRAVTPNRDEPDLALNLDICELVNRKKGNYPHDAVHSLLPYINGRSNTQALLALALLDNLVKNCGHSVHYQIGSREFLNELFRRFPEYQPAMPNPVHYRILEMLQEWRVSLCQRSRYREDLLRINDMYTLLCRKGWRFPKIDSDNIAVVLEPEDSLRTREELEKEDMEAMQAKLQELLRRATPRDLREANKLMKVITGYEQSSKRRDYDKEWEDELQMVERKVKLLYELLQKAQPGRSLDETARDLLYKCLSSRTRLQKLISENEDSAGDASAENSEERKELARIINLSDLITDAEAAVKALNRGEKPDLKDPVAVMDGSQQAQGSGAEQGSSGAGELISWDDDVAAEGGDVSQRSEQAQQNKSSDPPLSPLDDLAGLNFQTLDPTLPATANTAIDTTPALISQGMNTPGLSVPLSGAANNTSWTRAQPMTNPSLPTNSQQARAGKTVDKQNDVFDFSNLLTAAKNASRANQPTHSNAAGSVSRAAPNDSRTTSWGSSPDPDKKSNSNGGSLIDFMS
ncbi:ARF-binding protein [Coemansia guatemalensis]|uniref:ARF-binding protein n=1 Tax=Coemansia guatemalensis TaxID=2761395 RepID=A0A9W8HWA3_9FUNG|nr:ARF-binding protein [Coemansia guatemalensis]